MSCENKIVSNCFKGSAVTPQLLHLKSQPVAEVLAYICMCRSHQSVAMLLGRSCMWLEKTLTLQL